MKKPDNHLTTSPPDSNRDQQFIILITGAANGIGKATALHFASNGWTVIAADIDKDGLDGLTGVKGIISRIMDVRSQDSVRELFQELQQEFEYIDLIVNNAGIDRYFPLSEVPDDQFREIFEINFLGAQRVNRTFLSLLRSPGGKIFHLGSESYHLTFPFMPYPLTKRVLESYAKALRQELKFRGVDVVIIRPGAVQTRFIKNLSGISYPVSNDHLRSVFERFATSVPGEVGKTISPEQVAELIYRVAKIPHPKAVYRINNNFRLRLAAVIPFFLLEKAVARKLK